VVSVRVLLLAVLVSGCGPINIHSERTTNVKTNILRCSNPQDQATCVEVPPAPDESP
jgi:hypothetical protein